MGIAPIHLDVVIGVTKAYTTRVGEGPFPTEISDKMGKFLMEKGNEFGATTGRPRRCGWFDAVAVSYSCRLNGIQKIVLTKPDVLDGMEELKVCTAYKYKGEKLTRFPTESWVLKDVQPIYKTVKGWKTPVLEATDYSAVPQEMKAYIKVIEDLIEANVAIISTGVERRDTIFVENELKSLLDLDKIRTHIS